MKNQLFLNGPRMALISLLSKNIPKALSTTMGTLVSSDMGSPVYIPISYTMNPKSQTETKAGNRLFLESSLPLPLLLFIQRSMPTARRAVQRANIRLIPPIVGRKRLPILPPSVYSGSSSWKHSAINVVFMRRLF